MATKNEVINAVGAEGPADWDLKPDEHAAALPPAAGALKRILEGPDLQQIIETYKTADAAAKIAQTRYKRLAKTAAITSFSAVTLGGLLLLPRFEAVSQSVLTGASILQFTLLATSIISSLIIVFTKPFNAWMHERAKAETARIALFNAVLTANEMPGPQELPLLPLQLEYLRRYQLDVQRAYYKKRGADHAQAVKRAGIIRMSALALLSLAGIPLLLRLLGPENTPALLQPVASFFYGSSDVAQRVLLASSVVGGAMQGALAAYALMSQDERNAARYLETSRNLEDLAGGPLHEARQAAADGDRESVLAFATVLQDQISSEHREWIALRSVVPDLALGKLKAINLPRLR